MNGPFTIVTEQDTDGNWRARVEIDEQALSVGATTEEEAVLKAGRAWSRLLQEDFTGQDFLVQSGPGVGDARELKASENPYQGPGRHAITGEQVPW